MADLNSVVFGIDKATQRLDIARRLSDLVRTSGTIKFGESLEELNLGADHSSGQLMQFLLQRFHVFPDMFIRIANAAPRWATLHHGGSARLALRQLMRTPKALPAIGYMALNTVIGGQRNIVYTRRSLEKRITKYGFELVDAGADYTTSFKPQAQRGERIETLRLPQTFAGLPTLHEVCAVRK